MDSPQILEQRIAALQAELQAVKYQPQVNLLPPVQPSPPKESTEEMVKRLIHEQLNQLIATPVAQQASPAPMDFGALLLQAIGSGLTEQQQLWLSLPENQINIPDFLMTPDGQAITRRFFNKYTEYKELKCK